MDAEDERDLLGAILLLSHLIEQTEDPAKIAEYIGQLNKLEAKLITLEPKEPESHGMRP